MKQAAIKILNDNWENTFTVPSKKLYPFQWKWDSGFIAIGLAHFNMDRAKKEITTLLDAQWENGLIPHIVFHKKSETYFPGPDFHRADFHSKSSKKYKSTAMAQPPVIGFVLQEIYNIAEDKKDILKFISKNIDKVYANHTYFYKNRDPNNEGLAYIYHNWESGTDNSPIWDNIFKTMDSPEFSFERKDTKQVASEERPSKREYDHYLHIIDIAKKYKYDDKKIAQFSPFLVQDPLFNSILIKSNQSLIELYTQIGGSQKKIDQLKKWQMKSLETFNKKLYNEELNAYVHYDLKNNQQIAYLSSSSFSPIFAGIPSKERAQKLVKTMLEKFGSINNYLCASFNPTHKKFNPKKYWRGPVWINLNWMLYHGLLQYGYMEIANRIKKDSIELVEKAGFYEYFDPRKSKYKKDIKGCGGNNFSWTAALIIDLLNKN